MKSSIVVHKSRLKNGVYPMVIVSDNPIEVASQIIKTSDYCQDIKPDFVVTKEGPVCTLDPGGMFFYGTPFTPVEVEGTKFEIQGTKIEDVLWYMEVAKERLPGYMRFRMWLWNFIIPKTVFEALQKRLNALKMDDAVLHAHLNESEAKAQIEADCPNVRFNIPRERQ